MKPTILRTVIVVLLMLLAAWAFYAQLKQNFIREAVSIIC